MKLMNVRRLDLDIDDERKELNQIGLRIIIGQQGVIMMMMRVPLVFQEPAANNEKLIIARILKVNRLTLTTVFFHLLLSLSLLGM